MITRKRGEEDFKISYRPHRLEELVPTTSIARLEKIRTGDSPARVFLFEGPSGVGKTSTARLLARAMVCSDEDGPCLKCSPCKNMETSSDFWEVNVANFRKIDDIRDLADTVGLSPIHLKKRIYILDEVQQITADSQQLLLKVLEEPPDHVVFFLCTTDIKGLKKTLIDRANLVSFTKPDVSLLRKKALDIIGLEKIDISEETLTKLLDTEGESVRAVLNALQKVAEGDTDYSKDKLDTNESNIIELAKTLLRKDWVGASLVIKSQEEELRKNPEASRIAIENYLRAILLKENLGRAKTLINALHYLTGTLNNEPKISQYNQLVLRCAKICLS